MDGILALTVNGSSGNDRAFANVTLDRGSTGGVFAQMNAGADNDLQGLLVTRTPGDPLTVVAQLFGGSGFDRCIRTGNVRAFGCEDDFLVL